MVEGCPRAMLTRASIELFNGWQGTNGAVRR
jgi:hypothetical protein